MRTTLLYTVLCFLLFCTSQHVLSQSLIQSRTTTKSPLELTSTNAGAIALNLDKMSGGLLYPRSGGVKHQYLFGSGLWFGAKKKQSDGTYRNLTVFGYDPNTGGSRFVPGVISDGDTMIAKYPNQYDIYVSSDFNTEGVSSAKGTRWAVWDNNPNETLGARQYWGNYIQDANLRTTTANRRPAFISAEDVVSVYKDTQLRLYDIGEAQAKALGYPLRLDVLQRIFTWQSGDLAQTAVIVWEMKNQSSDTLRDCWFGYMVDPDIAALPVTGEATANDYASFVSLPGTHGLQYAWTNMDAKEDPASVAVVGISLLETPAVTASGYARMSSTIAEQAGTKTALIYSLSNSPVNDEQRYSFLSMKEYIKGLRGAADVRLLNATGSFHVLPGQTIRIAACITLGGFSAQAHMEDSTSVQAVVNNLRTALQQYYGSGITTGIREEAFSSSLSPSPNPANNILYLPLHLETETSVSVQVLDMLGRQVYESHHQLQTGENTLRIDCSSLTNGSYTLRCVSEAGVQSRQFMVVH